MHICVDDFFFFTIVLRRDFQPVHNSLFLCVVFLSVVLWHFRAFEAGLSPLWLVMENNPEEIESEWQSLPPELQLEIWSYLPTHDAFLIAAVCRQWRELSSNSNYLWKIVHYR